ncbi:hypothetical protein CHARACLAT_015892 [Characodon lateralis]|uniref:Uncharacterized protein n=1 Tax=Characodon lateralis TaxID=208331 RepID=A0ABU7D737_9TELE|nr:hypothetical protein [Characodon lateralis]
MVNILTVAWGNNITFCFPGLCVETCKGMRGKGAIEGLRGNHSVLQGGQGIQRKGACQVSGKKIHSTRKVTLCCAHSTRCKHRDKPWFSWHPAAAEHEQNEQKNRCVVKTERQSLMQQKRMIKTKQTNLK